jgi:hypothetical protein
VLDGTGIDSAPVAAAAELGALAGVGTDMARRSATYASTATPSATIPSIEPASAKCLLLRTMVAASIGAGTSLTMGVDVLAFATVVVADAVKGADPPGVFRGVSTRGADPAGLIPGVSTRGAVVSTRGAVVSPSAAMNPVVSSIAMFPVARPIAA